jgi:hypothetical protein
MTPIILEWSNAFDVDNNITGYELSYKTTGSWISLPFITSSQTSGSYSFTPTQQVTHSFRIRVRDSFSAVSSYKYFNYVISAEYQISSVYYNNSFDEINNDARDTCQIVSEPTNTYTDIYLSSAPPAVGVIVYTDQQQTNDYFGHNEYWIIKSPSGLHYSCWIDDFGVIQAVYLCGANSAQISANAPNWLGRLAASQTCGLALTGTVYWDSQYSFAVGTILYTDPLFTTPLNGQSRFFRMEYTNSLGLTLTKIVKVGDLTNPSVIVSMDNVSTVCSALFMAYRTTGTNFNTSLGNSIDGTSLCQLSPNTKCYIRVADPSIISTGDIVYTVSGSGAGPTFSGGNQYYNMYISFAANGPNTNAICQVDNYGIITVQGYCSGSSAGCCLLPGTNITLFDGSTISIEDIIGGESLLTYNIEESTFEEGLVTNIFTPIHNDIVKLVIGDNTIDCTSTHPFWSVNKKEWVSLNPKETMLTMNINIEHLEIGDILLNERNEEVILDDIIQIDSEDIVTYDISVEPNHTYYANSILVHNKTDENGNDIIFNPINNFTNP